MHGMSALSVEQREAAVALFETGWGAWAVATRLGVGRGAIKRLYGRWRTRGGTTLVAKPTRPVFSFEFKLDAVRRYRAGEPKAALAKELGLSSPLLLEKWAKLYISPVMDLFDRQIISYAIGSSPIWSWPMPRCARL